MQVNLSLKHEQMDKAKAVPDPEAQVEAFPYKIDPGTLNALNAVSATLGRAPGQLALTHNVLRRS